MTAPLRHVAGPIADESDLVNALRARMTELNISYAELDGELELPQGYTSKRLAWPQLKYYGKEAFWNSCERLGLAVMLVEDPVARKRYAAQMKRRSAPQAITGSAHWRAARMRAAIPWLITKETARELGLLGAKARVASQSPSIRSKLARKAAKIRWNAVKAAANGEAK